MIRAPKFRCFRPILAVLALLAAHAPAQAQSLATTFAPVPGASGRFDHSSWNSLLRTYVVRASDGVNRVRYAQFRSGGHRALKTYIARLQAAPVHTLSSSEQFAFWINLYNAVTVDVILDHYPVGSIRDIDISPGLFGNGPWGKKLVRVAGTPLSLDDIEHKILRPVWRDPRIHYAVNCASIGCPNLQVEAITGARLETLLNKAARAYINHPRGVMVRSGRLQLSKIYSWYKQDFGGNDAGIISHLRRYADPDLRARLAVDVSISGYEYDWRLNDAK